MAFKGSVGTSMGSIIRKPRVLDPNKIHCDNCKHFVKGICETLSKQTEGRIKWLTNKNDAKKCIYFTKNKIDKTASKSTRHKRNNKKYRGKKKTTNAN